MKFKHGLLLSVLSLSFAVAGCNAPDDGSGGGSAVIGSDIVEGSAQPVPDDGTNGTSTPAPTPSTSVGQGCQSSDPEHICLALKYVVYEDSSDSPVVSQAEAVANIAVMNTLWAQCNLGFQIDEYVAVKPSDYGFAFNTAAKTDLPTIRNEFEDAKTLLVVTTGTWSGTLGALSTNAWTMMPGTSTNGTIVEASSGKSPKLIAHELGHYLNLDHVSDTSNMMNPVIYSTSTILSAGQCSTARAAAKYYWNAMYR